MPSSDDILKSARFLANNYLYVAIVWHLLIYFFLFLCVFSRFQLSGSSLGSLVSLALLSVSFFAWQVNNPVNGTVFLSAGILLLFFSFKEKRGDLFYNPSFLLRATGIVVLFLGLIYPHFLGPQFLVYLYAAPIGILPCPTLLIATGLSMIFVSGRSRKRLIVLLMLDILYGLMGVFWLHVYLDIILLIASAGLLVQLILYSQLSKKPGEPKYRLINPKKQLISH